MENRLKTFKPMDDAVISPCCLRHVERNYSMYPGKGTTCPSCGTFMKSAWLDFNKSLSYQVSSVYKHDNKIEDFVPLSAIVLRNFSDTQREYDKKFRILRESVTTGLDEAVVVDKSEGREFIFNSGVKIKSMRILRLGPDIYALIAKMGENDRNEKAITGVTFALGGGGRGRKKSMAAFAMNGGEVPPNPQVRNVSLFS